MRIIFDDEITEYCLNNALERIIAIDQIDTTQTRPVKVLPIFEVCRALHFGAVNGHIQPDLFRTCWSTLVNELSLRLEYGHLIHVAYGQSEAALLGEAGHLLTDILSIGQVTIPKEDSGLDPRTRQKEHRALTKRFRRLHELAVKHLEAMDESYRGWACEPLDDLPDIDFLQYKKEAEGSKESQADLVLDTNNLIDLLNTLPDDGQWTGSLRLPDRLSERAVRWFRRILSQQGASGKLIVPISALEEAERVINYRQNHQKYLQARLVLKEIESSPVWPLRTAFHFEPFSHNTLSAFVTLYEQLVKHKIPRDGWPDFGDALVLAHGIANGCPVASSEWLEKNDWAAVGAIFDYLVLR